MEQNSDNKRKVYAGLDGKDEHEKRKRCIEMIQPYIKESKEWRYAFNKKLRIVAACMAMAIVMTPIVFLLEKNGFDTMDNEPNILYADADITVTGKFTELKTFCNSGCAQEAVIRTLISIIKTI